MKMSKVLLNVALVSAAALLGATAAPVGAQAPANCGGVRIAFIDVQRVLARSAAGVAARDQLEREKTGMQREMDGKRVELEKLREELEKKEQLLLQRVLQDLSGVIDRIGKERGCYLIVEKRGASVLYASNEADLTDEIIRAYDQQPGAKGPVAPGASPPKP